MHIKSVSPDLIGDLIPNELFSEHYAEFEKEFLDIITEEGYPLGLWPTDIKQTKRVVHWAHRCGRIPDSIPTNMDMVQDAYTGEVQHDVVADEFSRVFPMMDKAFFVFTKGEEWWPYEKAFLAKDANSTMLYFLYQRAMVDQSVLQPKPTRGRPRKAPAQTTRSEKSERYQQWLQECKVYREHLNELKEAYEIAQRAYVEFKATGAPKWIP